ncbi:MAG: thioredoxin family protein [Candidatus ainarchaeum sp.]|nr:thioredoxin family protein [Candidatus ainarchaeum sp.]
MPNEQVYLEVVTSPNCVHSPKAMKLARSLARKRGDVVLVEVSIATNEGLERAKAFNIQATPTIAVNGKVAFVGVPTAEALCAMVIEEQRREKERTSYFF